MPFHQASINLGNLISIIGINEINVKYCITYPVGILRIRCGKKERINAELRIQNGYMYSNYILLNDSLPYSGRLHVAQDNGRGLHSDCGSLDLLGINVRIHCDYKTCSPHLL